MAWIELHQSLTTHKKTKRLTRALGLAVPDDIPRSIGHLCMFWLWCIDNVPDGSMDGLDAQDIADAAGWMGDPELFLTALIKAGFVDEGGNGQANRIHDWDDYIGRLLAYKEKERERNREKQRRYRERQKAADRDAATSTHVEDTAFGPVEIDPDWQKICTAYMNNIGEMPYGVAGDDLHFLWEQLGTEVFTEAIIYTNRYQPSNPHTYLMKILRTWLDKGIKTREAAVASIAEHKRRMESKNANGNGAKPKTTYGTADEQVLKGKSPFESS